ncbi:efflux transporter outer membrane subunit [Cupriavidus plantarum]|uniref:efflux transporter outer membrane subunit n=1 Tax=Cupriavidus plantarum TaxID=942865 RepID=UPI000EB3564F|nr:efflux transporter outer membrane subunit [Cupriavidus plantarum]RLK39414.1 NodT family efflux transporter outer membrane factor (OMF) lipoprotein [Cupriavidus plantarum]CAG2133710.1 Outer membrane protein OprM [Cupriavidus plantarum]SMR84259.1 efflux transporter, outer membrane factor (OMF) lipoprotein, NodT family [Cupriavidus plantarum]
MMNQHTPQRLRATRLLAPVLTMVAAAVLAGCANYAGIHSDKQMVEPAQLTATESLPAQQGRWPAADWADQFGDTQLKSLIDEALQGSPTLDIARARVDAARAMSESANANTLPRVGAGYSWTRQRLSENALVPQGFGGSWISENKAVLDASYELDLWGKNREALKAAVSSVRASEADAEQVRLTLTNAIARAYNELARLYTLRDIANDEVVQRRDVLRVTNGRVTMGLDTEVEKRTAEADLATAEAALSALDGSIRRTRYQLGALLGKGPDRGLAIEKPALGAGAEVRLPDNLPADLLSRRPDIVAARWRVDATLHDIKVAKAEFYPDINLSAAIGLDAIGWGRFLRAASRTASAGPAIHLPIFDGGALRAQLKGRYADFDYAVANYNETLINALTDVATQLSDIQSIDAQIVNAERSDTAAQRAQKLAMAQYKAGLTTQLTVLNATTNALASSQNVANLRMTRRDRQIALASALGGGFTDASDSIRQAAVMSNVTSNVTH